MAIAIDRIGDTKDRLGESPVWSAREGCLYWVDSLAGLLHRLHLESGRREAFPVPAPIGSFGLCRGGGAVLALRDGFYRYDFAASSVIRNPADWVGHLADSGGGRRAVGWWAVVRERGHGADR